MKYIPCTALQIVANDAKKNKESPPLSGAAGPAPGEGEVPVRSQKGARDIESFGDARHVRSRFLFAALVAV